MGFSHLTPYVNLEVLVIFGGVFALKKLNFYTQVGVVRKPHFSAISGPFFEDFGINLVTDGWSSTGFGRGGFLDADPMGFFEAGEGRIDKGGRIESAPMFSFEIVSSEAIFWPVAKRDVGVLEFVGERERGSKGRIICEGIDASGVGFEVVTPLKSQIRVAGWDVFLFCRPLISD